MLTNRHKDIHWSLHLEKNKTWTGNSGSVRTSMTSDLKKTEHTGSISQTVHPHASSIQTKNDKIASMPMPSNFLLACNILQDFSKTSFPTRITDDCLVTTWKK